MGSAVLAAALPYPGKATRISRKGQRNTKEEEEEQEEEEEKEEERKKERRRRRKKERRTKKKNRTEGLLLANLTAYR